MDPMDDSDTQLEEECSSKPFTFSPMLFSGMAQFDINDQKPKRHPVGNGFQIFVFGYLMLLTAVASYLIYCRFVGHQELVALKEEMCSLQCLGKDVGLQNKISASQSEESELHPKIEEILRTLNESILSIEDKRVQRFSELEEEIGIIQVRSRDLFQRLDNLTLIPGPAGKDGPQGTRGIPGPPGVKGEPGNRGEPGTPGSPGIKGEKGDIGLQGLKGDEGKMGPTGPPGPSGSDRNGTKGEPGETGPPGAKGDAGERGQAGIPGRPGASGTTGEKGETGQTGRAGLPGIPGINGDKGEKGNQGLKGDPGQKGDIGTSGFHGIPGAKGEPGLPGLPGPKGDPGEKGNPGIQGPPGTQSAIVRLVGGTNRGRVEIFHGGNWGTICDDAWDMQDGVVICRMLGYSRAVQTFTAGGGVGKILLDDVSCVGTESSILECPKLNWEVHNCGHNEDAGVECGS